MRKLFEMGSLISVEELTSLKILGGYELVIISQGFAKIRKEGYVIHIKGTDIHFDMLMEQSALLSFTELHELRIIKELKEGEVHET
ncbi:hypothetical protein DVB69_04045 [Sporosarcina sp. BI001-red]|uniref:hypothetical protein n=1 Tax=Sporosarcina sp. BI001-red TaxID=2282866 RepID=UPI000E25035C|nr:hypothetical protein [Sporosarcina sp. BI001-red]REB09985.1 hypothetical protein DVB69_04045 [Sporosarcina sp. BI001-red]